MVFPLAAPLTLSKSIQIEDVSLDGDTVVLVAYPTASTSLCPECGRESSRVHSWYARILADLPWQARPVRLRLRVRRFVCNTKGCEKQTFAERLPEIAEPYARGTSRLHQAHLLIGHALGGEAGARLASPLGMPTSPDTLLRRVKASPRSRSTNVRVLGVDDWAWKKGRRYGTILCDLERRRVVDLLPERSTASFAAWLKTHPEVEVVSRDRGEEYTKGAALGAPQATPVADRWHLLLNLREALVRAVDRHHAAVCAAVKAVAMGQEAARSTTPAEAEGSPDLPPPQTPPSQRSQRSLQRRARRMERYDQVIELHRQGTSLRAIARRFKMTRATVRRWIGAGSFPERAKRRYSSGTDPHVEFLRRRWEEGCRNAAQLARELREQRFVGSSHLVRRRVAGWRQPRPSREPSRVSDPLFRRPSSRKVSWWLLREGEVLDGEEEVFLGALWQGCPELKEASTLSREFAAIVRERRLVSWDDWVSKVRKPGVSRELRRFADGLKQDEAAVKGALSLEWSNGQTEGQINRLKLLKRQMYGRAGFELLRSRCLGVA